MVQAKVDHASNICLTTMKCLESHKQVMQEQLQKLDKHQKLMEETRELWETTPSQAGSISPHHPASPDQSRPNSS